uniref:Putative crk family adapter n=1 Tax=Tabanus bromius TaxID=304241 RepID=A0A0K8TKN9_TABBR
MASFDVNDRDSWYFGSMSRQDATELLMNERERGVFLVRDSSTIKGDYVLCVREDTKVSHYIINKVQQQDRTVYRIGDQSFPHLPALLSFYKLHYLDTTPLRRPATRKIECVIGKFDFDGSDQDDLPFRRGEILTIISKDEDQWWTAKNSLGQVGQIPVPYVQRYDESDQNNSLDRSASGGGGRVSGGVSSPHQLGSALKKSDLNRKLPAFARVKQARVPNAYDKTALKLEVDDIITVTKTNINGQWEGELKGKKGHFPFTHVEFIDMDNEILNRSGNNASGAGSGGGIVGNNEWGD